MVRNSARRTSLWSIVQRALIAASLVLVAATPAQAGVVTMTESYVAEYKSGHYEASIQYAADAGERNVVTTRLERSAFVVRDEAGARAGQGCTATADPREVRCGVRERVGAVSMRLGDGDDRVDAERASVEGGDGDDTIIVREGFVRGGPGRDVLRGSTVNGGPGADDLTGATVSYGGHTEPIRADLDGEADDGAAGEGDRIDATVSVVVGGAGDDVLVGDHRPNQLEGGAGRDRIDGGDGHDVLGGGAGPDTVTGGDGDDVLVGPGGADVYDVPVQGEGPDARDVLDGGRGRDGLRGGPGLDLLVGGDDGDTVEGGEDGADVAGRDGTLDFLTCAGGAYGSPAPAGAATADAVDLVRGCATLDRSGEGRPRLMLLGQTDVDPGGTLRVGLACSQDHAGGCRGSVRLERRGRALARRSFTIAAGTSDIVRPRIPHRVFRRTRTCASLRLVAVIRLTSTAGRAFTIRRPVALNAMSLRCNAKSLLLVGPSGGW